MRSSEARRLGHRAILLVGDAPYYQRFGFSAEKTASLAMPGPYERHRFLALELVDGRARRRHRRAQGHRPEARGSRTVAQDRGLTLGGAPVAFRYLAAVAIRRA